MNKHLPATRFLLFAIVFAIAGILSSCGTTTYSTPYWATGYSDGVSPYYYFPDYDMYYDAASGQYYYLNNGAWLSSAVIPYPGVDLNNAYAIELNRNINRPWEDNEFYERNYPAHEEREYSRIVRDHNLIPNVPQNNVIVPRAYNENTNRMIFEERREAAHAQPGIRPAPGPRATMHQVPMRSIAPNMPAQARQYRYGGDEKGR